MDEWMNERGLCEGKLTGILSGYLALMRSATSFLFSTGWSFLNDEAVMLVLVINDFDY